MRFVVIVPQLQSVVNYLLLASDEQDAIETVMKRGKINFPDKENWKVYEITGFTPIFNPGEFVVDFEAEEMDDDEWYEEFGLT